MGSKVSMSMGGSVGDVDNALPKSMEPEEEFDFAGAVERVDGMQGSWI
jgi:hypothetical protein